MFVVFWTIGDTYKSTDHYEVHETELEAKTLFSFVQASDKTYSSGWAPIKGASEPHWPQDEG